MEDDNCYQDKLLHFLKNPLNSLNVSAYLQVLMNLHSWGKKSFEDIFFAKTRGKNVHRRKIKIENKML